MHNIDAYSDTCGYRELIDEFGREKIEKRLEVLLEMLKNFISKNNYENKVIINELTLIHSLFDYFADISRLKSFHHIEKVNEVKILAYESYWFLRRKPLQQLENNEESLYVNEQFILTRMLKFLSDEKDKENLLLHEKKMRFFRDTLYYYIKYRNLSPQAIEFFLMSFIAGEKYYQVLFGNAENVNAQGV
ncbi:MAG: hypothetical protein LBC76_05930 [Treponema sp.]|jgi:hypothetical protein|nr:hypothetical protein [Treponema sp.]